MIEGARDPARTILGVPTPTAWEVSLSLAHLVVIGLLAVGVSSVLALGMGALWGTSFVAGDPAGVTYTPSRCRELFEYAPGATTCEQAATEHHFAETVVYRGAAGVMGVLGAAAYVWLRRRRPGRPELLPTGFEATIGTTAFGMAALVLLAEGVNALLVPGHPAGAGGPLSAGVVSLAIACWFGVEVLRSLARR